MMKKTILLIGTLGLLVFYIVFSLYLFGSINIKEVVKHIISTK
jgi:hypothetical protein